MASGKRIIEAFASTHLKFKVTQYSWIKDFLPNYTDIKFEFIFDGQAFSGRGTDISEEFAIVKGTMESIERCVCTHHKTHTNGVAAHFNIENAKINARNELIERDVAICHYLTQSPLTLISNENISPNIKMALQKFENHKIKINLFQMKNIGDLKPTLCLAQEMKAKVPFGLILGLGCKENMKQSLESAFLECAKNVAYVLMVNKTEPLDATDFENIEAVPHNHFRYALNLHSPALLSSFIEKSENNTTIENEKLSNNFQYEVLPSDFLNLGLTDLCIVKATCFNICNSVE